MSAHAVFCQISGGMIDKATCAEEQGQRGCRGCKAPTRKCRACKTEPVQDFIHGHCSGCTPRLESSVETELHQRKRKKAVPQKERQELSAERFVVYLDIAATVFQCDIGRFISTERGGTKMERRVLAYMLDIHGFRRDQIAKRLGYASHAGLSLARRQVDTWLKKKVWAVREAVDDFEKRLQNAERPPVKRTRLARSPEHTHPLEAWHRHWMARVGDVDAQKVLAAHTVRTETGSDEQLLPLSPPLTRDDWVGFLLMYCSQSVTWKGCSVNLVLRFTEAVPLNESVLQEYAQDPRIVLLHGEDGAQHCLVFSRASAATAFRRTANTP